MITGICTLFEGHYHYGLAALCNSIYKCGFRGSVYIGYRGLLPKWATNNLSNSDIVWPGAKVLKVEDGMQLYFLPVVTDFHLTNYKPTFMLSVFENIKNLNGLIYFDPDIIIKCKWDFYKRWIKCGVSLMHEIISNDMPNNHPIRCGWRDVIHKSGRRQTNILNSYINGGFCGVMRDNIEFLEVWEDITYVGIKDFNYTTNKLELSDDRTNIFFAHDQDALNIAAMCCESPISEMGPEGMDFINGGWTMSHAVGTPKPWKNNYLLSAIKGVPPGKTEKAFWLNVDYPIRCYPNNTIIFKKLMVSIAALIGRFYKRF